VCGTMTIAGKFADASFPRYGYDMYVYDRHVP
jgi:hypothetical protein